MARAVSARDAGLRRVSAVTRWLVLGALALSGALALIASQAFHGRTTLSNASARGPSSAVGARASGSEALTPAAAAPTATPAAPVVVSGGS
jgi:hypothetical protein